MPEPRADHMIYPVMLEMAACLRAQYGDETMPEPVLVTGETIPLNLGEDCENVVGYVRVSLGYPSEGGFPAPEAIASRCSVALAFQLFVGVARCVPVAENDEWAPPTEVTNASTERQLADMAAIRRAIVCCLGGDKFEDMLYSVVQWQPQPQEGPVVMGEWQVVVQELMV